MSSSKQDLDSLEVLYITMNLLSLALDPMIMAMVSAVTVLITFCILCVETWVEQDYPHRNHNDAYNYGLFIKHDGDLTGCDDYTSSTACGYLTSAQFSGVIFLFLGVWTMLIYIPRIFENIPVGKNRTLSSGISGLMQGTFGLICAVCFANWKTSRLEQDDRTNMEYKIEYYDSKFLASFYFLIISIIICWVQAFITLYVFRTLVKRERKMPVK